MTLIDLPGWRWMPGMQARGVTGRLWRLHIRPTYGIAAVAEDGAFPVWERWEDVSGPVPVLSDAGTAGCLVALLGTEAWRVRYSPSMHKHAAVGLGRWGAP